MLMETREGHGEGVFMGDGGTGGSPVRLSRVLVRVRSGLVWRMNRLACEKGVGELKGDKGVPALGVALGVEGSSSVTRDAAGRVEVAEASAAPAAASRAATKAASPIPIPLIAPMPAPTPPVPVLATRSSTGNARLELLMRDGCPLTLLRGVEQEGKCGGAGGRGRALPALLPVLPPWGP